jgi:hypothetical protein
MISYLAFNLLVPKGNTLSSQLFVAFTTCIFLVPFPLLRLLWLVLLFLLLGTFFFVDFFS